LETYHLSSETNPDNMTASNDDATVMDTRRSLNSAVDELADAHEQTGDLIGDLLGGGLGNGNAADPP
jgi:hypothetical protein